ncbi:FCD domain-containing protein [uncultured Jannaschia sp.]|uniref:FCD domain-containing protein n=1 Tax=uncultured Jannaschia sp. TaxID=293347 RepID=UPI0026318889|nr:FCD domain-containing protein [uncultured Jannaschia sp.]
MLTSHMRRGGHRGVWLLRVHDGLHDQCERFCRTSVYRRLGFRDLGAEHVAIAQAPRARDADHAYACALTEQYFALTAATLRENAEARAGQRAG